MADESPAEDDPQTGVTRAHAAPVDAGLAPLKRVPAAEPVFPSPGTVLEGKYRLAYRIATGQMSSVWCAEHVALSTPVAIKFLQPGVASDADGRRRFLREARIASALRSPHVAQVLDYGVERDTPYIVMEFLEGESLAGRLRRRGRLAPLEMAAILAPIAPALRRGHDLGVVHRDLKPENIFIVPSGGKEVTKLLDFGVAKVRRRGFGISVSRETAEGEIVGTPHYMSPEQARGAPGVDLRTDVWALGVIAFECLLGYPPFVASGLASVLTAICVRPLPIPSALGVVPVGFDAWFACACARVPEGRFSSLDEAVAELCRVCADARAVGPNRIRSMRHALRRLHPRENPEVRGVLRWLAALAILSLLVGAAVGAAQRGDYGLRGSSRGRSPASARPAPMAPSAPAPAVPVAPSGPANSKCCEHAEPRPSNE